MLDFFRRYQRSFFIVITVVIIVSFSFFGTFQTFSNREQEDKVAFTAIDGSKVRKSELSDMVAFLTSDAHDFLFSNTSSGNALNDGVISNDFLETGLAQVIAAPYLPEIGEEEQTRLEREKRYTPYAHPKAPFLTAEQIWAYYAPDIKNNFERLRSYDSARSFDAFSTRVNLFVAERKFPAPYLKQFLRYQESSHKWLPQDPNLAYQNLALFGYYNAQDWFGRNFIELMAQYIINSAKIAEQKGYKVTKEEALGSLFRNAESAFRDSRSQGLITGANAGDFFQDQLRRLGLDQSRAVKVWTQVLLFRTLFFENADSVLVDTSTYAPFYHHLNEYVDIDYFQLPQEFRFSSIRELEQFAIYLSAVGVPQNQTKKQELLILPEQFLSPSEVKKAYPELVERKVVLRWSNVNKDQLQTKIGVKNTWEWQVADKNWNKLKEKYPELAGKADDSLEARLAILDKVDPARRSQIDSFSRQEIIEEHPEWIKKALEEAALQEEEVSLREQGGKLPFEGIKDQLQLLTLIDSAPLNEWSDKLSHYSQDGVHIYRIQVLDRSKPELVLSFADAKADRTMDKLLDKTLESSYSRLRTKEPALFLKDDGEWKPFKDVKDNVANLYFESLLSKLDREVEIAKEKIPGFTDWSDRQKARLQVALLPFVEQAKKTMQANPEKASQYIQASTSEPETTVKSASPEQFKLVQKRERLVRRDPTYVADPALAFTLHLGVISPVNSYQQSGPAFFAVVDKGYLSATEQVRAKVLEERELLGREALAELGRELLHQMRKKDALQLEISHDEVPQATTSAVQAQSTASSDSSDSSGDE